MGGGSTLQKHAGHMQLHCQRPAECESQTSEGSSDFPSVWGNTHRENLPVTCREVGGAHPLLKLLR